MEYVYMLYGSNGLPSWDWDMDAETWLISVHKTREGAEDAMLDRQTSPVTPAWEHSYTIVDEPLRN